MKKVLIIEDEKNIRENIEEILQLKNYEVKTADNGKTGIMEAMLFEPDIILCDIMMPEMDGYEVIQLIRQNKNTTNIPFIFLTAKSERQDTRKGMNLGADDYLTKPFKINELTDAIETRLQRAEKIEKTIEQKIAEIQKQMNQTASHEYNTPLNGILGFTDLMIEYIDSFDKKRILELLDGIKESGLRLQKTLQNILFYNNLQSLNANPTKKRFFTEGDISLFEDAVKSIAVNIAKNYQRTDDLKINVEAATLQIPDTIFNRITEELIDNALKFSEPETDIEIYGIKQNNTYRFTIKDYGRGMKPEYIKSIAPFKQFERDIYAQQGSGLGLYIVQELLKLNNGKFKITSKYEKETSVMIELNLTKEQNIDLSQFDTLE